MAITNENLRWAINTVFDERLPKIEDTCRAYTNERIKTHKLEHDLECKEKQNKLTTFNKIMIVIGIVAILGIDVIKHWVSSLLGIK